MCGIKGSFFSYVKLSIKNCISSHSCNLGERSLPKSLDIPTKLQLNCFNNLDKYPTRVLTTSIGQVVN